jgi:signal transduction histidine kinase
MIFRRSVTARSWQVKRESLGLGRRIVEAHGGQIVADGEIGRGATSIVTLPIGTITARLPQSAQNRAEIPPSEALEPG